MVIDLDRGAVTMLAVMGALMSAAFVTGLVVGVLLGLALWTVVLPAMARVARHRDR